MEQSAERPLLNLKSPQVVRAETSVFEVATLKQSELAAEMPLSTVFNWEFEGTIETSCSIHDELLTGDSTLSKCKE
jgi:hypothetical protein